MPGITSSTWIWGSGFALLCLVACNSPVGPKTSQPVSATYVLYSIGGQPLPVRISDTGPVIVSGTLTLKPNATYTSRQLSRPSTDVTGDVITQTASGTFSITDSTLTLHGDETTQYAMTGSSLYGLTSLGRHVVYQLGVEQSK